MYTCIHYLHVYYAVLNKKAEIKSYQVMQLQSVDKLLFSTIYWSAFFINWLHASMLQAKFLLTLCRMASALLKKSKQVIIVIKMLDDIVSSWSF